MTTPDATLDLGFSIDGLASPLRVVALEGREAISELFAFHVTVALDDDHAHLGDVVGRKAKLQMDDGDARADDPRRGEPRRGGRRRRPGRRLPRDVVALGVPFEPPTGLPHLPGPHRAGDHRERAARSGLCRGRVPALPPRGLPAPRAVRPVPRDRLVVPASPPRVRRGSSASSSRATSATSSRTGWSSPTRRSPTRASPSRRASRTDARAAPSPPASTCSGSA